MLCVYVYVSVYKSMTSASISETSTTVFSVTYIWETQIWNYTKIITREWSARYLSWHWELGMSLAMVVGQKSRNRIAWDSSGCINANSETADLSSIYPNSSQLCRQLVLEWTRLGNFDLLSAKDIFLYIDLILWELLFFFFPFSVSFTFWGLFHEKVFYENG